MTNWYHSKNTVWCIKGIYKWMCSTISLTVLSCLCKIGYNIRGMIYLSFIFCTITWNSSLRFYSLVCFNIFRPVLSCFVTLLKRQSNTYFWTFIQVNVLLVYVFFLFFCFDSFFFIFVSYVFVCFFFVFYGFFLLTF